MTLGAAFGGQTDVGLRLVNCASYWAQSQSFEKEVTHYLPVVKVGRQQVTLSRRTVLA